MKTLPPCDHDECPPTHCIQNANAKGVGSKDVLGRWQQAMLLVGAMIIINGGMSDPDPVWKWTSLALAVLIVWVVLLARDKRHDHTHVSRKKCHAIKK